MKRRETADTSCILQKSHHYVDRQCDKNRKIVIFFRKEDRKNGKIHFLIQKENKSTKEYILFSQGDKNTVYS
jgi:hypothetical protein